MTHLLSWILFTPLAGAVLLLFVNKRNENAIRWIANVFGVAGFVVSVPLWFWYDPKNPDYQFVERLPWIPSLGAEYFLGVDGFSALLILLTTLMGVIAILSSWTAITERVKEYYIFLLVLQTGMIGAFVSLDFLLFFLFWEVMLVPMYFLIGIWGSDRRLYSAIKFFLYTLVGSVVMLLGILAVYFHYHAVTGQYSFDVTRYQQLNIPFNLQWWVFLAFFLGFAIKVPMFPFHTWLPDAHTDAPTAGSVILAAILLKMGTYGFIRFSLPILPEASRHFVPFMAALSIIAIVYGALVAMAQRDWKRLVAYSSVSHMGMVTLGMFALNPVGITGSIVQQLNHGISTGALFLIVGIVYERRHTRQISEYGGLSKVMPVYAAVFLVMTMSSIGLPTLNGFIGEFLILQGVFVKSFLWAAVAGTGIVLGAAYMLWLYQRTMFGKVENPKNERLADLSLREFATFAPLIILAVWIGLYPSPFLVRLDTSVTRVLARVGPEYVQPRANAQGAPTLRPAQGRPELSRGASAVEGRGNAARPAAAGQANPADCVQNVAATKFTIAPCEQAPLPAGTTSTPATGSSGQSGSSSPGRGAARGVGVPARDELGGVRPCGGAGSNPEEPRGCAGSPPIKKGSN
ncbi:MAG: NADH-quinone oxidoreductase subunit M [Acidobacteria bacterium]|nr:NADH-quinone oxidoreductase subunit M [Acidobacteriota bacterium]